jgi:hypothetical protein
MKAFALPLKPTVLSQLTCTHLPIRGSDIHCYAKSLRGQQPPPSPKQKKAQKNIVSGKRTCTYLPARAVGVAVDLGLSDGPQAVTVQRVGARASEQVLEPVERPVVGGAVAHAGAEGKLSGTLDHCTGRNV